MLTGERTATWVSSQKVTISPSVFDYFLYKSALFYLFAGQRLRVAQTDAWADLSNLLDSLHSQPEAKAIHTQADQ